MKKVASSSWFHWMANVTNFRNENNLTKKMYNLVNFHEAMREKIPRSVVLLLQLVKIVQHKYVSCDRIKNLLTNMCINSL